MTSSIILWLVTLAAAVGLRPASALVLFALPAVAFVRVLGSVAQPVSLGHVDVMFYDAGYALAAIRVLWSSVRRGRIVVHRVALPQGAFLLSLLGSSLAFSGLRGDDVTMAAEIVSWTRLFAESLLPLLLWNSLRSRDEAVSLMGRLAWFGNLLAAGVYLDVVLWLVGNPYEAVETNLAGIRFFGPVGDPASLLLPFFACLSVANRQFVRAAIMLVACLLTGGRAGLIMLASSLLIVTLLARPPSRRVFRRGLAAVSGLAILGAVVFAVDAGGIRTRLLTSLDDAGTRMKVESIQVGARTFAEHPLLGVGFMGFRIVARESPEYQAARGQQAAEIFFYTPTNEVLHLLAEGGLIGLAFFLWFAAEVTRLMVAATRDSDTRVSSFARAALAWFMALAVFTQTTVWIVPISLIQALLFAEIGVLAAARRRNASRFPEPVLGTNVQPQPSLAAARVAPTQPAT